MRLARTSFAIATASLLLGVSGCRRFPLYRHKSKARASARAPQRLTPLAASNRTEELLLPHFAAATISVPVGARFARPIVIALHSQFESQAASCAAWSAITDNEYFVLCPALNGPKEANGAASNCTSVDCLAAELREGLVALRKRYARYVARNEVVLTGRGSGAARAVPIALQNPAVFSVVWLIDGGLKQWATALSVAYAQRGGKYLGLVCGDASCESEALRVGASARTAGLVSVLVKSGPLGPEWAPRTLEDIRLGWRKSKPAGWPWSVPGKI